MTPDEDMPPERPVFAPSGREMHYGRRYTRWALWGCAGLVLALLLLFLGFMLVMLKGPNGEALLTETEHVGICREHLTQVAGALDRYHKDKGRAPANLMELYPTYLADKSNLRCPSDPTQEAVSYVYRPGVPWGKGDDIAVYCPHHKLPVPIRGVSESDQPYILLFIRQDGQVAQVSTTLSQIKALRAPAAQAAGADGAG